MTHTNNAPAHDPQPSQSSQPAQPEGDGQNVSHEVSTTTASDSASLDASLASKVKKTPDGHGRAWLWVLVAVIVVVAIIVAAAVTNGRKKTGTTPATTANDITLGMVLSPTNLDIRTQSGSALDQLLIGNVYEPLLSRDSNNKAQPGLAKSWDVSSDGTVYTFHLNDGITFSNGDALTADDVAWSISELESNQYKDYDAIVGYTSVEATDDSTVVLTLSAPYSQLLWNLTGRAGLVFDKDANYDAKTQAIGSGPYLVDSFTANDSARLVANPKYWGANKAQINTVTIKYYADSNAAVNAISSGDIQTLSGVDYDSVKQLSDKGYSVQAGDDTDKMVLAFNNAKSPLTDIRVRQAIRYAIDEDSLIAARGGVDKALGGPIPDLDPGYEDLTNLYPHDIDKAKQLLSEAGYSESNPLKLTLTYANIYSTEIGDQLTSQLADAGIQLTVNRVEFSAWLSDVYTNHDYDLSLVDHNESHDFASWTNPDYYFGYDNATVQSLYKQAMASTDDTQADSLLAQAAKQVSQDAAADWLFNFRVVSVWNDSVKNFPVNMNQTYLPLWQISLA